MATVATIEEQIKAVEHFDVHFIHTDSKRRLHARTKDLPEYPFTTQAPYNMSANRWCRVRFNPIYPGYTARILTGNGSPVRGPERLYAVRNSYT